LEGHPGRQGPPRPQKYTIFGWSRTMYTKTLLYVVEFKAPKKTQTSRDMFRKWGSAFSGFPGRRASVHD
jgi:hypothetical protein